MELLYDRVLKYPYRVQNLYFTFLFVLRAVTKVSTVGPNIERPNSNFLILLVKCFLENMLQAADYLEQAEYDTGNHSEDLKTESLMKQLLYSPKLQAACPLPFDEAKLWQGQSGPQLKQQIQKQFRNIRFISKSFVLVTTLFLDSEMNLYAHYLMCS